MKSVWHLSGEAHMHTREREGDRRSERKIVNSSCVCVSVVKTYVKGQMNA